MKRRRRVAGHVLFFLAPATIVYTAFVIYPLVGSLRLSLFEFGFGSQAHEQFVGLDNFQRLFFDPNWGPAFWRAVSNTLVLFAVNMVVQNPLALLLALLLTSRVLRARGLFRGVIFAPAVLSFVLVGFIWKLLLSPLWGVAPGALDAIGLGSLFAPWLGLEGPAMIAVSLMSVWQWVGIPMLLFSAALLGISDEILDAARTDGAGAFRMFWNIKLPLILPTVGIVAVLTFVGNSNAFDIVYTVQGANAGPNFSTDVLGTFFYRTFFGWMVQQPNPSMGATIASVTFLAVGFVLVLYFFALQRRLQRYDA